ncbi:hypothetical protein F511_47719 [Dorcoceras hygrometricum]|uniref:Uncharacterized protein n=1 Tax=Dorcoceras hygrometricum TaxID=472368 RepID=A0A2Z6ZQG2_9LAMI|nr:hypothetical protein F511_47719 [Dorcoceras hygrometricum]
MVAGRLRHGRPRDAHWLRDGMGRSRAAVRSSWRAMILAARAIVALGSQRRTPMAGRSSRDVARCWPDAVER